MRTSATCTRRLPSVVVSDRAPEFHTPSESTFAPRTAHTKAPPLQPLPRPCRCDGESGKAREPTASPATRPQEKSAETSPPAASDQKQRQTGNTAAGESPPPQ